MQGEEARSPPLGEEEGRGGEEEPGKTVYFVPIYAVAIVDPNKHVPKSQLSPEDEAQNSVGELVSASKYVKSQAAEQESIFQHKKQKLILMRKRGRIPDYDDDDPHKPTPKRLRNRMKAQKSRDKKKAYMSTLESKVKELLKINSELEDRCKALRIENELLRHEIPSGPLTKNGDPVAIRFSQRSEHKQAVIHGGFPLRRDNTSTDIRHACTIDKFACGSDDAEGSPSRYIRSYAQDDDDDDDNDDDIRHDIFVGEVP